MHLSGSHLPRSFPIGSTYVVEGRGGGEGDLRVFSRYVVLPGGGKRINISDFAGDFGGPASPRVRAGGRARNRTRSAAPGGKPRSARTKKIVAGRGTTRRQGG